MWLTIREMIGWLLVVLGLALIAILVNLAVQRQILEALALTFPATIVFRAGIGLIRLATSARIARELSQKPR